VASADNATNANEVCNTTIKQHLDPHSIVAAFERKGKGQVAYSLRQYMKMKARQVFAFIELK
jgi:hypothetical protein